MARPVLHRVCHDTSTPTPFQESLLVIKPALLYNYTRRKIRGRDYPAIIPTSTPPPTAKIPAPSTLSTSTTHPPTPCVRGTFVTGLTSADLYRLDIFEADEYVRKTVIVTVLDEKDGVGEVEEVQAEAYVWAEGMEQLEDEEWDFEDFVRDKMGRWVGREEYVEVDEAADRLRVGDDPTGGRGMGALGREEGVLGSAV